MLTQQWDIVASAWETFIGIVQDISSENEYIFDPDDSTIFVCWPCQQIDLSTAMFTEEEDYQSSQGSMSKKKYIQVHCVRQYDVIFGCLCI